MKAFKKWWAKEHPPGTYHYEKVHDCIAGETWKAALEWVYDKLDHSQEHEEIKDVIEEELTPREFHPGCPDNDLEKIR
ncbi:hypothetical protein LCGC14_0475170 [marine sediment metagenome]|uniref:Uncharacterized protein n=1 Tax=marine sediment metagenome TaxID=412755 RepID=A0A0F9SG56_9ZZZZ